MTATSKARNKLLRCTRVCIPSNESYPNVATHLEICPLRSRVCCLELYAYGFPLKQDSLQVLPSDTPNYSLTLSLSLFLSFSRLVSRARHHHRRISITSSSIRFDSIRFDSMERNSAATLERREREGAVRYIDISLHAWKSYVRDMW